MLPSKLEMARPHYSERLLNLLQTVRATLEAIDMSMTDVYDQRYNVDLVGILSAAERYWIKAELAAAGWSGVYKLRDSENETLVIYMA